MNNPDKIFKDKLYHLETPLGGDVSFEKVMAMRQKDAGSIIWWKPALLVLSTLSVVSVTGYFWFQQAVPGNKANNTGNSLVQANSEGTNSGRDLANNKNNNSQNENTYHYSQSPGASSRHQTTRSSDASGQLGLDVNSGNSNGVPSNVTGAQEVILVQNADNAGTTYLVDAASLKSFGLRSLLTGQWTNAISADLKLAYEFNPLKPKCLPSVELMMATGAGNVRNFNAKNAFSVRGNHRFGQYTAVALWDLNQGFQLGAGIGFAQFAGNGEWRQVTQVQNQKVTTQTIVIVQPGFPDQTITKYDTTMVVSDEVKTGSLNYTMSKFSAPIALRYYMGEGRGLIRISATVAPGILVTGSGTAFNKESYMVVPKQNSATLDARLGVGLYYPISTRTALIFEPGVSYQSVLGGNWQPYNRFGLGLGLGVVIKP